METENGKSTQQLTMEIEEVQVQGKRCTITSPGKSMTTTTTTECADDTDTDMEWDEEEGPLIVKGKGRKVGRAAVIRSAVRKWQLAFGFLFLVAAATAVTLGLLYYYKDIDDVIIKITDAPTPEGPSGQYQYAKAAVAADAGACSEIGRDMLMNGGSAADAAIAGLLCVGLHNAHSAGIGGGFFMMHHNARTGTTEMLDAREVAPSAATEDMFADEAPDASLFGGLAIGVPGEIAGYWLAHQRYGVLTWQELFEPSIYLAEKGFQVGRALASAISAQEDVIKADASMREIFLNSTGGLLREGDMMTRPKLAETYRKISLEGGDAFYGGDLADDIVADVEERGGIITKEDLAQYRCKRRTALMIVVDDVHIYSPPPPGSGAVFSLAMNILEGYKLSPVSMANTENAILTTHRMVESFKFAYAGRSFLGDEDFVDVKELVANMTSQAYADSLRAHIDDNDSHDPSYYTSYFNRPDSGTAHLSVVDGNGNAVSVTSTVNTYFGSKVRGNRTGIIFNNEMDDFSQPNATNFFGLPPSPSNFIRPGKRPMSSMVPVIAISKDGTIRLVVGASGGSRITTGVAQVSADTLWFGDGIKEAIQRRRLHHQLVPNNVTYEAGYDQDVIDGLREKGNFPYESGSNCVVQGILRDSDGFLNAYSDDRKGGYPAGI